MRGGGHDIANGIVAHEPENVVAYSVMVFTKARARRPRWFFIPVRVLLVTFLLTLLSFALSLLFGILGTVIAARLQGIHPNMTLAYRHIALPVAAIAGSATLVAMSVLEIRRYWRERTLIMIEQVSSHG